MPEGDTIRTLATFLDKELAGQSPRSLRLRDEPGLDLGGTKIERVRSHGKHLFVELEDGIDVRSHLGMHGSWHQYPLRAPWKRPARQASLIIEAGSEVYVCFNAKEVELVRRDGFRARDLRVHLGPDLLKPHDVDDIVARARETCSPESPLIDVLLDQRVAAGIGNVYKSEVLFVERQAPLAFFSQTSDAVLGALYRRAAELLARNIKGGPRRTRFVEGGSSELWVYRRDGRPCLVCDALIRRARLGRGQRSTYWCPSCQAA